MKKREVEKRTFMKWKKIGCGVLAATLVVSSVTLTGCGSKETEETMGEVSTEETVTAIQVETAVPGSSSIEVDSDFIGTVEADKETSIIPKISGEITSKNFEVGDYVNAGDLLFTIDDSAIQISRQSAEANVESAAASVNSAEAGLIAQQASNAATKASVNETMGTLDTKEQQLENNVNSAKRGVGAAQGNFDSANQAFATTRDNTSKTSDKVESADRSVSSSENYLQNREGLMRTYNTIAGKSSVDDAKNEAKNHGCVDDDFSGITISSASEVADIWVKKVTAYKSGAELSAAVSSARTAYESAKASKTGLEGSYSNALLSQIQSAIQTQITKDSILTAKEAEALTKKLLEDFQNYTKATVAAQANASIVGGDAAVISSNNSLTAANAGLKSAQANLASANLQLTYTQVTTPVSGRITAINVEQYGMASPQAAAYVISSEDSKKITFYVAENAMRNMRIGQSAVIDKDGNTYEATVSAIESTVDAAKGLFKVEAVVQGGDNNFITGTSVKLTTATQQAENAMTVPIDSVYYDDEQAYVYLSIDGKAVRTDITTGISDESVVQVTEGLHDTDKVIISWASQLKDGAVIEETALAEKELSKEQAALIEEETSPDEAVSTEEETSSVEEAASGELVEATDIVNVRKEPGTDSEKVGLAAKGQKFERLEETEDGWSKIIFEGSEAFVKTEYLQTAGEDAVNE